MDDRKSGIGGSDVAAMLGVSPWRTPYQLWLEKTGRAEPEVHDEAAAERMRWGTVLEYVIAEEVAERLDVRLQRIRTTLRHPQHQMCMAHLDRVVVTPGSISRWNGERVLGADALVEIKTMHDRAAAGGQWGEPESADIPAPYWLQVQWYMAITRLPVCLVPVLFGGQRLVMYRVPADAEAGEALIVRGAQWWQQHVVEDVPPAPTTAAEAGLRWPRHAVGKAIETDDATAALVERLRNLKREIAELEEAADALRDEICIACEDAEALTYRGATLATWRAPKPSIVTDWRAVASAAGASQELIAHYTREQQGARRLLLTTIEG